MGIIATACRHLIAAGITGEALIKAIEEMEDKGVTKEKKDVPQKNPPHYPLAFEEFWKTFPTDPGMSKQEALKEWGKLSDEDHSKAIMTIPAFKTWVSQQGKDYRTLHARTFLSQRRFDGFAEVAKVIEVAATTVYVKYGTDPGDAWDQFYRSQGKIPPRDFNGGWRHPSEYPPNGAAHP